MTLVIRAELDGVLLTASTNDGRRGERAIAAPASLVPVALGLIASIPPEARDEAPAVHDAPPEPAELPPPDPPTARGPAVLPPSPPSLRLDVSLSAGARFGFPTRVGMVELEARADAVAGAWLVIATARYAPFGSRLAAAIPGYIYDEVVLGLGVGRRWSLGAAALDVSVSPELAVMTEEGDVPVDGTGGTDSAVRLAAAARLHVPLGETWKPSVTIDAELAPAARATRVDAALPPLPTWTLGLRAGAVGNVL